MKHGLSLILFCLIIISGCTPAVNVSATQTADAFSQAVKSVVETQNAVVTPSATVVPPTSMPINTPTVGGSIGTIILDDKFDQLSSDWETSWMTPHSDKTSKSNVRLDKGWLYIDLQEKGSIAYEFNKVVSQTDVVIDTINQIGGPGQTEVAVVCRANNDYSSWIDFRILYMNEYAIYKYDRKAGGSNPFKQLVRGPIQKGLLIPGENNEIRATCNGNELSLDLNNSRLTSVKLADNDMQSPGLVGVGGIGPTSGASSVWFDYLTVSKPQ